MGLGALALIIAIPPLLPTILSTRLARPLLQSIVGRCVGAPVEVEAADLSWRGPSTFHRVAVASPPGFGDANLLEVERATLAPGLFAYLFRGERARLRLDGTRLEVVRAPAGAVNLGRRLGDGGREAIRAALGSGASLELNGTLVVSDRTTRESYYVQDLATTIDTTAGVSVRASGRTEGPSGTGAVRVEVDRSADGATLSLALSTRNLDLGRLEPALQAFIADGSLAGTADFDLTLRTGPGRTIEFAGEGQTSGLSLAGSPWIPPATPVADSHVHLSGAASLDLDGCVGAFDGFHLASSLVELKANGRVDWRSGRVGGDLEARFSAAFERVVYRLRPLLVAYVPLQHIFGDVDVRVAPHERGGFRVDADARDLYVDTREPPRRLAFGDSTFRSRVDIALEPLEVDVDDLETSTRFCAITGTARFVAGRDGAPSAGEVDLATRMLDTRGLAGFIQKAVPGISLLMAGYVDAHLVASADAERVRGRFDLKSQDFDWRYEVGKPPRVDLYNLWGKPIDLTASWDGPRGESAVREATGAISLRAPGAAIDRNELSALELDARLEHGTLRSTNLRFDVNGGTATGSVALDVARDPPRLELELDARDIGWAQRFPTAFAARVHPIFAATGGAFRVDTTQRMSATLSLTATGRGWRPMIAGWQGLGRLELTDGVIEGSPLLEALTPPYGAPGPRTVRRVHADFRFENGWIVSDAGFRADGRGFALAGRADGYDRFEYVIPADALFDPTFLEEHAAELRHVRFEIGGQVERPVLRIPDPLEWRRLAERGELARAIQKLGES